MIVKRIAETSEFWMGPTDYTNAERKLTEKKVEKAGKKCGRTHGWYVRKFKSPSNVGAPDDVFIKEGRVVFIEYKRVGKEPTKLQRQVAAEMLDYGAEVWWTDTVRGTRLILKIFT